MVSGHKTSALLDTGSTISTVSQLYFEEHMQSPMMKIETLLDIECANGQQLPYLGYTETCFQIPGISQELYCLSLVVTDSRYNKSVPLLLGTNALAVMVESLRKRIGDRFLQDCSLTTPWYLGLRCITLREKILKRNNDRLGVIRSGENKAITVPPNSYVTVKGYLDKEIPYNDTSVILQSSPLAIDHPDFDIEPGMINYQYKRNGPIDVRISNVTMRTISIPSRAIIGEIQPVTVQPMIMLTPETEIQKVMDKMHFTQSDPAT